MDYIKQLIERYPALSVCENDIRKAAKAIIDSYEKGGKLLVAGNGGSAADSDHICGELLKSFVKIRKPEDTFLEKLKGIADKYGIIYNPKVVNTSRKPVFQHLAKNLFSYPYKTMENDGSIKLYEGLNPRDEVAFVCSQILTDIETKKMLPQEFAIVCNPLIHLSLLIFFSCFKSNNLKTFLASSSVKIPLFNPCSFFNSNL